MREIIPAFLSPTMCGLSCVQYVEITTLVSLITHPGMNPKAQAVVSQAKCPRVY